MVDYKSVALNNDSDSEDEFVNIVVPLFEQADSEITKSAVKEMLSRSTELKQKGEKKMKGKRGVFFCFILFLRPLFLNLQAWFACKDLSPLAPRSTFCDARNIC